MSLTISHHFHHENHQCIHTIILSDHFSSISSALLPGRIHLSAHRGAAFCLQEPKPNPTLDPIGCNENTGAPVFQAAFIAVGAHSFYSENFRLNSFRLNFLFLDALVPPMALIFERVSDCILQSDEATTSKDWTPEVSPKLCLGLYVYYISGTIKILYLYSDWGHSHLATYDHPLLGTAVRSKL
jgi:hypothetical protein